MRETAQLMSTSMLTDIPRLRDAGRRLRKLISIQKPGDPAGVLQQYVHATDCPLLDPGGDEWKRLINSLRPDTLRRQIEVSLAHGPTHAVGAF